MVDACVHAHNDIIHCIVPLYLSLLSLALCVYDSTDVYVYMSRVYERERDRKLSESERYKEGERGSDGKENILSLEERVLMRGKRRGCKVHYKNHEENLLSEQKLQNLKIQRSINAKAIRH
jgi:hypothetical protein